MKYLIGLLFTSLTIYSFGQTKNSNDIEGLTINANIKKEAEQNIQDLKDSDKVGIQLYQSKVNLEFYENDSLIVSTSESPKSILSKSCYLWRGDTLIVEGGIGLFVGAGFLLKLIGNKATVYHMVTSDESPTHAYGEKTDLVHRLEVACQDVKIVLSGLPVKGENQIIYGYVEFKSDNYFTRQGTIEGKEIGPRKKSRANMKMYFRSGPVCL